MVSAAAVTCKGREGVAGPVVGQPDTPEGYPAQVLVNFIDSLRDVVLQSDGEPTIRDLVGAVRDFRTQRGSSRTIAQSPPAHSSASNGAVKAAIQYVVAQVRTLRLVLEMQCGVELHPNSAVWP